MYKIFIWVKTDAQTDEFAVTDSPVMSATPATYIRSQSPDY